MDNFVKKQDWFGQSFRMKLDEGHDAKNSFLGGVCSLILLIVIIVYAYQKADVLIYKKDVDILSTTNEAFFDADHIFDATKGFAFAAAFTAYDGDPEPILEPEYGEIIFNHFSWGPQDDGTYATSRDKIEPHVCTDEELNLDGKSSNPLFLPVIE